MPDTAWFTISHQDHPEISYQLAIDPDDKRADRTYKHGTAYEPTVLSGMAMFLDPGETFVDVGAHVGNHTMFMAMVAGARVIAIEPNPLTFGYLQAGVDANELGDRVRCHQVAIGEREATGRLEPGRSLGVTSVSADPAGDVEIVPLTNLVDEPVRVMKIDVEGGEGAAVRGALPVLEAHRPVLVVETNVGRREVKALLGTLGYRRFPLPMASRTTHFYLPSSGEWRRFARSPVVRRRIPEIGRTVRERLRRR